jgi:hypothetical protein
MLLQDLENKSIREQCVHEILWNKTKGHDKTIVLAQHLNIPRHGIDLQNKQK